MATRIGVDVGGTFTDLIGYDEETGRLEVVKMPSTPDAPDRGVLDAVAATSLGARARYFFHGSTVGLNALLERSGARVGLLATEGFRDVLEARRGDRADPYDLFWSPGPPLVPRRRRIGIPERTLATGAVRTPLAERAVRAAAEGFIADGVDCVAIAFINAYANPDHELRAAEIVRAAGFDGPIALSHAVSGEYREYERTTTTVVDAYIRPKVSGYLERLECRLRDEGVAARCLVARSGGGSMAFDEAQARPHEAIMSGPVGGAEGAARLAHALGLGDLVTADVGGTSFDTCLITDGRPVLLAEGFVAGLPLQTPWVDVRSIGAGGGSIAAVDAGGLLRVGPRSAGAQPGPACYGRGGIEPTVTDAAMRLGMLGPGDLAAGLQLDADAASEALAGPADQLGLTVDRTAQGVIAIAASSMADAIREITIEQGRDPREMALVAFGGAGPLFACLLADELGIVRVVVPPHAGNFSAWELLNAQATRSEARTVLCALDEEGLGETSAMLRLLGRRLRDRIPDEPAGDAALEAALDLRFRGQEHALTLAVATNGDALGETREALAERFAAEYHRSFGQTLDEPVEIVTIRATLRTPLPEVPVAIAAGAEEHAVLPPAAQRAWSFSCEAWRPFALVRRGDVGAAGCDGPCLITEPTTTTYVDTGFTATVHETGALLLTKEPA